MSRYSASDLARLGAHARRQVELALVAHRARDDLRAEKAGKAGKAGKSDLPAPRRKYGNQPCWVGDERFDSGVEAERWMELRLMERAGLIGGLVRQPEFPITVNGTKVCSYFADFEYTDGHGRRVVEDVKSPATAKNALYRLKRKLVEALHGVTVTEV